MWRGGIVATWRVVRALLLLYLARTVSSVEAPLVVYG